MKKRMALGWQSGCNYSENINGQEYITGILNIMMINPSHCISVNL